jgi:hypothetical protein
MILNVNAGVRVHDTQTHTFDAWTVKHDRMQHNSNTILNLGWEPVNIILNLYSSIVVGNGTVF